MQNDRENDTRNEAEDRQVQRELEDQLRAFGDTMSDAFAHGFEGRGMDIGDRAYDVGKAAVHAANFGIGEAARAFRRSRDEYRRNQQAARHADWAGPSSDRAGAAADASGMPGWFRQMFGGKQETTPVDDVRTSARKRHSAGIALLVCGITFAVICGITGVSCLAVADVFTPGIAQTIESVTIEGGELVNAVTTSSDVLMGTANTALLVTGNVFSLLACGFGFMIAAGASRLSAAKKLLLFADAAEGMDYKHGLSLQMLADLTHQKKNKALKRLRKYIRKGWLTAWLDEKTDTLYLTAEDYRAAQEVHTEPQPEPAPQKEQAAEDAAEAKPLNLETARRFAAVLEQEQQLMRDEQAREELCQMQKTTLSICDWLETHPESMSKARRFAEYYIPTTLKLLHTYNDVQGQQGTNAENIRRDIAGILHTLNQAYSNLYDTLLSDVALDVSSEIAALQGMLANDGLTGGDFV